MANYYGSARTNYFKVKDMEAFDKALENVPDIEVVRENIPPYSAEGIVPEGFDFGGVGVLVSDGDCGGFPSFGFDEETGDDFDIDLGELIADHLADGEVAILMECGAEKLRYVVGWAEAINNKRERRFIQLGDIYDMAKTLTDRPEDITKAEY